MCHIVGSHTLHMWCVRGNKLRRVGCFKIQCAASRGCEAQTTTINKMTCHHGSRMWSPDRVGAGVGRRRAQGRAFMCVLQGGTGEAGSESGTGGFAWHPAALRPRPGGRPDSLAPSSGLSCPFPTEAGAPPGLVESAVPFNSSNKGPGAVLRHNQPLNLA